MLGNIIGAIVVILVAISIFPTIMDQFPENEPMKKWTEIFFISAIVVFVGFNILNVITELYSGNELTSWNVTGDDKIEDKKEPDNYKEYVKDRLDVEKLMR